MLKHLGFAAGVLIVIFVVGGFIFLQMNRETSANLNDSKKVIWKSEGYNYIIETDDELYSHSRNSSRLPNGSFK